jgi:hypothetical protein
MAAAQVERPFKRQLYLRAERRVVAECVRRRTAASEKRNSRETRPADRQLCGSLYDRCGRIQPSLPRGTFEAFGRMLSTDPSHVRCVDANVA